MKVLNLFKKYVEANSFIVAYASPVNNHNDYFIEKTFENLQEAVDFFQNFQETLRCDICANIFFCRDRQKIGKEFSVAVESVKPIAVKFDNGNCMFEFEYGNAFTRFAFNPYLSTSQLWDKFRGWSL
jgi:hypothetical protein